MEKKVRRRKIKRIELTDEELTVFNRTVRKYHRATESVIIRVFKDDLGYDIIEAKSRVETAKEQDLVEESEDGKWLIWIGD